MPNIKSAIKRVKVIDTKTLENKKAKREYRAAVKAFEAAVANKDKNVNELYTVAVSSIDKAWSKGVLKKNTAARNKAKLAKNLAK